VGCKFDSYTVQSSGPTVYVILPQGHLELREFGASRRPGWILVDEPAFKKWSRYGARDDESTSQRATEDFHL
jgi:hypothetical protein